MPVIKNTDQVFPEWSELDYYIIDAIGNEDIIEWQIKSDMEILFVCDGRVLLEYGDNSSVLNCGDIIEIPENIKEIRITGNQPSVCIRIGGNWKEPKGNNGIFSLQNSENPKNIGDAIEYIHKTDMDNHYHDCDEYWIIYKGSGKVVTEGDTFDVYPGDCVATKMGDHHNFPEVFEKIYGVYFETTLKGQKRKGHLWTHTHN